MGKQDRMCGYDGPWCPWYTLHPGRPEPDTDYEDEGAKGFSRKRVKCPICGRRVRASTRAMHDGDIYWRVPPHKRKGWWKRR